MEIGEKRPKRHYDIEASKNGSPWRLQGSFAEGQDSRFGAPFNDELAVLEAESFAAHRGKEFVNIRLVIHIQ